MYSEAMKEEINDPYQETGISSEVPRFDVASFQREQKLSMSKPEKKSGGFMVKLFGKK